MARRTVVERLMVAGPLLLLAALVLMAGFPGTAGSHDPQDALLEQVGVDEKLGGEIPADLNFRDQAGKEVRIADYFTGGPILLTLNYYACPTLCPLVMRNLAHTVGKIGTLSVGRDFRIVTVSINPDESPALTREKSGETYRMLEGVTEPGNRWPFLQGDQDTIGRLARSVGVRYVRAGKGEFAHPNVLVVVTPERRVSRYLYGLEPDPRDLKLALLEAAGGGIGSPGAKVMNRALLYCFHYDPVGKKYVLFASRLMTAAMLAILALTLGGLGVLWNRERGRPNA